MIDQKIQEARSRGREAREMSKAQKGVMQGMIKEIEEELERV